MKMLFVLSVVLSALFSHVSRANERVELNDLGVNSDAYADELPGCAVRARPAFTCGAGTRYTDNGCAISCPATKTPVCSPAHCDGTAGIASSCYCK